MWKNECRNAVGGEDYRQKNAVGENNNLRVRASAKKQLVDKTPTAGEDVLLHVITLITQNSYHK